jgi:hypothetical protein
LPLPLKKSNEQQLITLLKQAIQPKNGNYFIFDFLNCCQNYRINFSACNEHLALTPLIFFELATSSTATLQNIITKKLN